MLFILSIAPGLVSAADFTGTTDKNTNIGYVFTGAENDKIAIGQIKSSSKGQYIIKNIPLEAKFLRLGISNKAPIDINLSEINPSEPGSPGGDTGVEERYVYFSIQGDDGAILNKAKHKIIAGESVLDLTLRLTGENKIEIINRAGYIESIGGIKEKKPGYPLSGWIYKVNGSVLGVSSASYRLADGDIVEWIYTLDGGKSEGGVDISIKDQKEEKAQEVIDIFDNYTDDFKNLKDLDEKVLILNLDKKMDKDKAIERDERLKESLLKLEQLIDITKDNIITDKGEKVKVLIPKEALDKEVNLTVTERQTVDLPNSYPLKMVSPVYEMGPKGLSFNKPVKISMPLYLGINFNPEELVTAFYDEENNEWEEIPGIIDLETGWVLFETDHFSKFAVIEKPAKKSFADIDSSYKWATEAVEVLAGQGVISGSDKGFEPARSVTRAEFSQLVNQMIVVPGSIPAEFDKFSDVSPSDWFNSAVSNLYQAELISGYEDGTFRPEQPLSRNEATMILYKLSLEPTITTNVVDISDYKDIPEWATSAVNWAYSEKIISGYEDGSFQGLNSITRAEAAVIIFNWIKSQAAA